jgi:UDP-N-acetyl-D-galactosamine dehydrogenase
MDNIRIGIIGLGYVGLPLFWEFSKKFDVKGFDVDVLKINLLKKNDFKNIFEEKNFLTIKK